MGDLIVSVPDHCLSFYFAGRKTMAGSVYVFVIIIWVDDRQTLVSSVPT